MKIFKTTLPTDGALLRCDTIEHEGEYWLVPEWIEYPNNQWQMPARIICLSGLDYTRLPGQAGLLLEKPIPKSVLYGETPGNYRVIDRPQLRLQIPVV